MADSYGASGFYQLAYNSSTGEYSPTGSNLVSALILTESTASNSFVPGESASAVYVPSSAGPASLVYLGKYNNDSNYLVFTDPATATNYIVTNSSSVSPATAFVTSAPAPICLFAGTRIRVPGGTALIEELQIGDLVVTDSGIRPLKFLAKTTSWIGTLRSTGRMPVCVSAGAFGEAGPSHDLWMSPSHAVKLADCLVEAGALCNGGSVHQPEELGSMMVDYYNLEFEDHEIIYANDLAVESYYANWRGEVQSRASWDNYADYVALYGEGGQMQEQDLPRIPFARQLPVAVRELIGTAPKELVAV